MEKFIYIFNNFLVILTRSKFIEAPWLLSVSGKQRIMSYQDFQNGSAALVISTQ